MDYQELTTIFSQARLKRYLEATGGDGDKAYNLYYRQNIYCGIFFALTSYFEVIFRNKINTYMVKHYDENWLIKLSQPTSPLNKKKTLFTYQTLVKIREDLEAEKEIISNDKMVAKANFGFWSSLFQINQYNTLGVDLVSIFVKAPPVARLLDNTFAIVKQVRLERNRIAHNESIIFRQKTSIVDLAKSNYIINKIKRLTHWLGVDPKIYDSHLKLLKSQREKINNR
jgi:hypothetical protein